MLNVSNSVSFGMGFKEIESMPLSVAIYLSDWINLQWEKQEHESK